MNESNADRAGRAVVGVVLLIAGFTALNGIVPQTKWLAGGIGAGLAFSAATNTCAMGTMLSKLPYNRTDECDIAGVLDELNRKTGLQS